MLGCIVGGRKKRGFANVSHHRHSKENPFGFCFFFRLFLQHTLKFLCSCLIFFSSTLSRRHRIVQCLQRLFYCCPAHTASFLRRLLYSTFLLLVMLLLLLLMDLCTFQENLTRFRLLFALLAGFLPAFVCHYKQLSMRAFNSLSPFLSNFTTVCL